MTMIYDHKATLHLHPYMHARMLHCISWRTPFPISSGFVPYDVLLIRNATTHHSTVWPPFDQAQTEEEREMRKQQELEKRRDEERQAKHGQTTDNWALGNKGISCLCEEALHCTLQCCVTFTLKWKERCAY
jgi:hypothetical protein